MKNTFKESRQIAGWSQAELAKRRNVSRQTVHAVERGRYDPSLLLGFAIAQLFERRIEQVFQLDI